MRPVEPSLNLILLSTILAVVPPLWILRYYLKQDRRRPEPKGLIVKIFLIGCLSVVPLALIEMFLMKFIPDLPFWLKVAIDAFVVAALVEELGKRWVVMRYAYPHTAFDEVHDGVVYTIVASLGFALLENIMYAVGDPTIGLLRAFTAVPLHAVASGLMGVYIGMAKFTHDLAKARALMATGLCAAVGVHGLYDFVVMSQTALALVALPIIFFGFRHLKGKLVTIETLDAERHGAPDVA